MRLQNVTRKILSYNAFGTLTPQTWNLGELLHLHDTMGVPEVHPYSVARDAGATRLRGSLIDPLTTDGRFA